MKYSSIFKQDKTDWDSLLMLFLSVLWILITLGIILIWYSKNIYQTAKTATPNHQPPVWIIFGKKLQKNQLDYDFIERLNAVIFWTAVNKPTLIILQGGVTGNNTLSEAQAAKEYLIRSNIFVTLYNHGTNLVLEDLSKNTLENLKQTRELLQQQNLPLTVTLVSNRYHLLRCETMALNMGFRITFLPAEKTFKLDLKQVYKILLEAIFINWYHTGRFISKVVKNQRMLKKIH